MLLKALYDLGHSAERHILDDMAFEKRSVRWIIDIDANGQTSGIGPQDTSSESEDRGHVFPKAPRTARVKKGKVAEFLADGVDAVFGLSPNPGKPKDPDMLREKCDDFWRQVQEAATETQSSLLKILCASRPTPGECPPYITANGNKWKVRTAKGTQVDLASGQFTFRVNDVLLIDEETAIQPYWRKQFAAQIKAQEDGATLGPCLITGDNSVPVARTHNPRLTGIPGVDIDGAVVSFEKSAPAFSSYGQEQSYNAPCSIRATWAYSLALQYLLDREDHHVRLGNWKKGTVLCFWARNTESSTTMFSTLLNKPQPDAVRNFILSPFSGMPRQLLEADQFLAVTLTGNSGRVVIRHWIQCPLDKAITNLSQWFMDLAIETPYESTTSGRPPPLAVNRLAECTVPLKKKGNALIPDDDKILPDAASTFYRAALEGTTPQISLVKPMLDQFRSRMLRDAHYKLVNDESRFALLKLILNRNRKETEMEMQTKLVADTSDPAYNCGRLLAVLAATQDKAGGYKRKGPGVAERYYRSASVSPGTVFPLLLGLNRHHLDKISKSENFAGGERFLEQSIRTIVARFKPATLGASPEFPRTLDLHAQGRFAMGFYQQAAQDEANRQVARTAKRTEKQGVDQEKGESA